jgi:hypothetical protein
MLASLALNVGLSVQFSGETLNTVAGIIATEIRAVAVNLSKSKLTVAKLLTP